MRILATIFMMGISISLGATERCPNILEDEKLRMRAHDAIANKRAVLIIRHTDKCRRNTGTCEVPIKTCEKRSEGLTNCGEQQATFIRNKFSIFTELEGNSLSDFKAFSSPYCRTQRTANLLFRQNAISTHEVRVLEDLETGACRIQAALTEARASLGGSSSNLALVTHSDCLNNILPTPHEGAGKRENLGMMNIYEGGIKHSDYIGCVRLEDWKQLDSSKENYDICEQTSVSP